MWLFYFYFYFFFLLHCTVRDQPYPAVFLEGIIIPHGLARGLLGCWTQEPATLLYGYRRMKVLAMHFSFLCLTPAPCPCRALEPHLDGRRTSINCSNGGDHTDAMFDLRTVGKLRPTLHVHVDCPSLKEGGELTQACALSLSFAFTFFISRWPCQVSCKHLIRPGLYVWMLWG